ncbi:MAG: hypothetical protein M3680_24165, partial [Myxococcota bacterium]|nr:hypothetical protein [Myxococcota bacterium]
MALARSAAVTLAVLVGCSPATKARPRWPDAPVQLRDDSDRDAAIDRLWVTPAGAERDAARAVIARATVLRIAEAIQDERPFVAASLLEELTWMWQDDPANLGAGLAPHVRVLQQLRAVFAKTGALEPAVHALVVLAEVEPQQRAEHLAELDEILAFADELALAEHGEHAKRAQPLALLGPAAVGIPVRWLVDRYVALLVERQIVVSRLIDQQGASMQLVRAHQDILSTARRIAIVLARAARVAEIHRHLEKVKGIGSDRELTIRAEVIADQPTANAFAELASELRVHEHTADPAAALAVALAGLARFPKDAELLAAAGGDARTLGRVDQAIELYEASIAGSTEVDAAVALRLGKLYAEQIARLASNGRPTAATTAWRRVLEFTRGVARARPHDVWQQTAAIAQSALGKGLASQGLIADGRGDLTSSLHRAPSLDAYETLANLDVQTERFASAERWSAAGMALLGETTIGDRYRRAKLERLTGDALRRSGRPKHAGVRYLDSLRTWASLGDAKDLPRAIAAERLLESGRSMWWLGDAGRSVDLVMAAVEHDPTAPAIPATAVAFLLEVGRYRDAVDACHRGLGEPRVGELYKVYTSLWIVAEARHRGEPADPLASEYLASRRGDLWFELLAQAASGRLSYA